MIFKQNVHLTIGLSELPLVQLGDRNLRELCLSAPRAGYGKHKICGRVLEVCNVGGDWLTLAISVTSPGTQIVACIEKRDGVVNAVHAYDPYDLDPGVEGTVSYVYFEDADEVITVHGYVYGQRYPGEVEVADIWGNPLPADPMVAKEFAFLNHRTVKFRDEAGDNIWVGEFTGKLLLPEWNLDGALEGAVPAEVTSAAQAERSIDNVARLLKQDVDHIVLNTEVTCSEVQAMATGAVQMTGSLGIDSVPDTVPQRSDVQGMTSILNTKLHELGQVVRAGFESLKTSIVNDPIQLRVYAQYDEQVTPRGECLYMMEAWVPGDQAGQASLRRAAVDFDAQHDTFFVESVYAQIVADNTISQLLNSRLLLTVIVDNGADPIEGVAALDLSEPVYEFLDGGDRYVQNLLLQMSNGTTATGSVTWIQSDGNTLEIDDFALTIPANV